MSIVIFLIVLAVLVFVHELGHFIVAKKSGIRVDEFAIGFPPKLFSWTRGETKYVFNLIPFGGYVKIFGENPDDESLNGPDSKRSFVNAPKWKQTAVLVAGVSMNMIFAWILISMSFMIGNLMPVGDSGIAKYSKYMHEPRVIVTNLNETSAAKRAGVQIGDTLLAISDGKNTYGTISSSTITTVQIKELVSSNKDKILTLNYSHSGENKVATMTPETVNGTPIIGVYMENVGVVKMNFFTALWYGADLTITTIKDVAIGLSKFIYHSIKCQGHLSDVTGPIGLVDMVGQAAHFGWSYLFGFIAFISLNLAVINLMPFPALDGGRVLFVAIEAITRRPIKPRVANALNGIGFILLMGLMVVITVRDIINLI